MAISSFLRGCWSFEHRPSCFCSKHSIHWVISWPAHPLKIICYPTFQYPCLEHSQDDILFAYLTKGWPCFVWGKSLTQGHIVIQSFNFVHPGGTEESHSGFLSSIPISRGRQGITENEGDIRGIYIPGILIALRNLCHILLSDEQKAEGQCVWNTSADDQNTRPFKIGCFTPDSKYS